MAYRFRFRFSRGERTVITVGKFTETDPLTTWAHGVHCCNAYIVTITYSSNCNWNCRIDSRHYNVLWPFVFITPLISRSRGQARRVTSGICELALTTSYIRLSLCWPVRWPTLTGQLTYQWHDIGDSHGRLYRSR